MHRNGTLARRRRNQRLAELRINAGLSPNALGQRSGVSGNTVRLAEAGWVPLPGIQHSLATALGTVPIDIWPLEVQRTYQIPRRPTGGKS